MIAEIDRAIASLLDVREMTRSPKPIARISSGGKNRPRRRTPTPTSTRRSSRSPRGSGGGAGRSSSDSQVLNTPARGTGCDWGKSRTVRLQVDPSQYRCFGIVRSGLGYQPGSADLDDMGWQHPRHPVRRLPPSCNWAPVPKPPRNGPNLAKSEPSTPNEDRSVSLVPMRPRPPSGRARGRASVACCVRR